MKPLIKAGDCKNIQEIRDVIDALDLDVIKLFAQRHEYVKEIVKFKSRDKEGIIAQDRKEVVLNQRRAWAEEEGLDGQMMEEIFRLLIEKNIQIQIDISNSNNN